MIHLLGWAAVILQAHYSYHRRPFSPGMDHRAELPAIGYAAAMVLCFILLTVLFDLPPVEPLSFPRDVLWVPVA